IKDFAPIAKVTEGFQIVVVHPSSPWKSIKGLVEDSKSNPGKLNYAHTGPGGLPHLSGELFMLRSGAKLTGISYRSGGESVTAVLSRAVDVTLENVAILAPLIRDGKVRALAVANSARRSYPTFLLWPRLACRMPKPILFLGSSRHPARRRALFAKSTVR